jgi:hypothetical protein
VVRGGFRLFSACLLPLAIGEQLINPFRLGLQALQLVDIRLLMPIPHLTERKRFGICR